MKNPETWKAYPTNRGFDYFFEYIRHKDDYNRYPAHDARERSPVELYHGNEEISDQLTVSYTTDLFTAAAKKWIVDQKQKKPDQSFLELTYNTSHAGLFCYKNYKKREYYSNVIHFTLIFSFFSEW